MSAPTPHRNIFVRFMYGLVSIRAWRKVFIHFGNGIIGKGCAVFFLLLLGVGFAWQRFNFGNQNSGPSGGNTLNNVVLKVDGMPVTALEYDRAVKNLVQQAAPGQPYVQAEAQAIQQMIGVAELQRLAKEKGVKVSSSDVAGYLDAIRTQANMQKASDSEWSDYIKQHVGMSLSELSKQLKQDPSLLQKALLKKYEAVQNLTLADANNLNQQVNLDVVLIPAGQSPFMPPKPGEKPLTDSEAKLKAEMLLAKVKAGGNIGTIAKENSGDFNAKKGGVTGYRPEYSAAPNPMGDLGYGPAFDAAVHGAQTGQLTPVVKATGILQGYIFAKVLNRKTVVPKGFDAQKSLLQLRTARASAQLNQDIMNTVQKANVQVIDQDKMPYYLAYLVQKMQQQSLPVAFGGQGGPQASPQQIKQLQDAESAAFAALLKKHPDDPTAALMTAQNIKQNQLYAPGVTPAEQTALRNKIIKLYRVALTNYEDRNLRFDLADLYEQQKDTVDALKQYNRLSKYLAEDPPYNSTTDQQYIGYYQRLQNAFSALNQPEKGKEMQTRIQDISRQMVQDKIKEAAAAKQQSQSNQVTIPPGGSVNTGSQGLPPVR